MELDTKTFFKIGAWAFFVIGLMNAVNFFVYAEVTNIFAKISNAASIIFNFVVVWFFMSSLKQMSPQTEISPVDMEKITQELDKDEHTRPEKKARKNKKA